jgi:hypothetical protein
MTADDEFKTVEISGCSYTAVRKPMKVLIWMAHSGQRFESDHKFLTNLTF